MPNENTYSILLQMFMLMFLMAWYLMLKLTLILIYQFWCGFWCNRGDVRFWRRHCFLVCIFANRQKWVTFKLKTSAKSAICKQVLWTSEHFWIKNNTTHAEGNFEILKHVQCMEAWCAKFADADISAKLHFSGTEGNFIDTYINNW